MLRILSFTVNSLTLIGLMIVGLFMFYPSPPTAADTTGVEPKIEIIDVEEFLEDKNIDAQFYSQQDVNCLTENMYFEARSDGYAGMYATSMVVMNRVLDDRYPNSICEVVKQGPIRESWKTRDNPNIANEDRVFFPIRNQCQFSWYCDGKADVMHDKVALQTAKEIAHLVLDDFTTNGVVDITEGATHYHTVNVSPYWADSRGMMKVTQVGSHIFYKWN